MIVRFVLIVFYAISVSLFAAYLHLANFIDHILPESAPAERSYEYIIVGAGTAGTTLAASLPPNTSVLLLESGSSRPTTGLLHNIPLLTPLLQRSPLDWSRYTQPQRAGCGALRSRRSRWPAGRGYGGSQILNYMMWTRGHAADYADWFSAHPADYDYSRDIEPHFRRAEELAGGPQPLPYATPLAAAFVNASREAGYATGFGRPLVTQRGGRRHTAAHRPHRHDTVLGAHVQRLLFTHTDTGGPAPHCNGLVYSLRGELHEVRASRGVILAAGTIGSPAILLRSGIGPPEAMPNATEPIVRLAGVGGNLQDHVTTGVDLLQVREPLGTRPWDVLSLGAVTEYVQSGGGPWASCGCEALGFVSTTKGSEQQQPDIGFMVLPTGATGDAGAHFRYLLNIAPDVWAQYFEPLIGGEQTASILPVLLHPRSRGRLQLSADGEEVLIDPDYLADAADVETMVEGLRIVQRLVRQPAMQKLGVTMNERPFPGCEHLRFGSGEYWRCYVRQLTLTAFHPVGTCRMGGAEEADAVVGRDFAVHGVSGVWVVDASVMRNLPSGNPNAVVAMLAARFAAERWGGAEAADRVTE